MARFARGKAAARIADAAVLMGEAAPAENPASRQELFHTLPYSCSVVAQRGAPATREGNLNDAIHAAVAFVVAVLASGSESW